MNQQLNQLIQKYFSPHNEVIVKKKLQGQKVVDNRYVIGMRAGPLTNINIDNLLHEICHLVEIEEERLVKRPTSSWGLNPGKFWQIGSNWGYETFTDDQVKREQRVWAYQLSLNSNINNQTTNINDSLNLVSSARFLNAWTYYQPFEIKTYKDEDRIKKLAEETFDMSNTEEYSYDKWLEEWNKRINKLKETRL